jgi:hypothetical protein
VTLADSPGIGPFLQQASGTPASPVRRRLTLGAARLLAQVEKHNVHATKKVAPAVNATTPPGADANATVPAAPACGSCYGAEDKAGDCCNTCDEVRSRRPCPRSSPRTPPLAASCATRARASQPAGAPPARRRSCLADPPTCSGQVRTAYRRKGWALSNVDHVEQCAHDAYTESIKEQAGEGCHMWGTLEVSPGRLRRGAGWARAWLLRAQGWGEGCPPGRVWSGPRAPQGRSGAATGSAAGWLAQTVRPAHGPDR